MKTPLAWKNLSHNKVRTLVGVAGVSFAVILIFMQLGFRGGIINTATQIYDALDFHLMIRSPAYLHLTEPRTFSRQRVFQAESLPEVERARPFYLGLTEWQAPIDKFRPVQFDNREENDPTGQWRGIIAMGTDPHDSGFKVEEIRQKTHLLTDPRFVLIDTKSKPEYGPKNGKKFESEDEGVETTLGPSRIRIVGLFELGAGMASSGACLTSPQGFVRACPWQTLDDVNFGLVKLHEGVDPNAVKKKLEGIFGVPAFPQDGVELSELDADQLANVDVEILTPEVVKEREIDRWLHDMPMGQIFSFAVWLAIFVGIAIVYQVLSTDIDNMMSEYATLKAIGYSNTYLTIVVLQQSILLAIVGYIPSLAISWVLYWVVEWASGMPMMMTWEIGLMVLFLAIFMCVVSGLGALRKLFKADPVDLF